MLGIIILVVTALIVAIFLFADKKKLKRLFIAEVPETKETPEVKDVPEIKVEIKENKKPTPHEPAVSQVPQVAQVSDDMRKKQNKAALREIERKMERLAVRNDVEGLKKLSKERNSLLSEMGSGNTVVQNDELDEYTKDLLKKNNFL